MDTSHFIRSTVTGRIYHIDSVLPLSCHTSNFVYLLTCLGCSRQYVGESMQKCSLRMNGHRQSLRSDANCVKGCNLLGTHFVQSKYCRLVGFKVQILYVLSDMDIEGTGSLVMSDPKLVTSIRCKIERYYMSKLRTCYPYGLNDRFGHSDLFINVHKFNIHTLCFSKLDRLVYGLNSTLNLSPTVSQPLSQDTFSLICDNELEFLTLLKSSCKCTLLTLKPCMEVFTLLSRFIAELPSHFILKLLSLVSQQLYSRLDHSLSQHFLYSLQDLLQAHSSHLPPSPLIIKDIPSYRLTLHFTHKSIESLDIRSFLHSSDFMTILPTPLNITTIFKYSPPISCNIFN